MKKKALSAVIALAICLGMIAGCANEAKSTPVTTEAPTVATECQHEYTAVVTKEATYSSAGETTYTCKKCGDQYVEPIAQLEKHVVSDIVLNSCLANMRYYSGPFSITVAELMYSAISGYEVKYYSGEEAIRKGYLSKDSIDKSVDLDCLYYAVMSGNVMINPDLPYLTNYEDRAVEAWMVFDENDNLQNYGLKLCKNLETCAILLTTSGY